MPYFGCHLSITDGYGAMAQRAVDLGADTFAFFTRPPRGGKIRALDEQDMASMVEVLETHGFGPLVAHAPYIYNLAAAKDEIRERAITNMVEDLGRCDLIPGCLYNFHPGAHVGQGAETGIQRVAEALDRILVDDHPTQVLLETMAGKGTELGRDFEELAAIMDATAHGPELGVCLDTCHISDGGYDVVEDFSATLDEFDAVIGLERLSALHLNDSMNPRGAHKDRHEKIGRGHLGLAAFQAIVQEPRVAHLPMILETPNENEGYALEIRALRALSQGADLDEVAQELEDDRMAAGEAGE